jgi:hypothetical protein
MQFEDELHRCARQFFRVESTLFEQSAEAADMHAMRVSITCPDGFEVDQVVHLEEEDIRKVVALEEKIQSVLGGESRLGVIAATRIVRALLAKETQ